MRKLEVAIVAPSLDILGGHSVLARSLLREWSSDADVHAWLVPINPAPPAFLRAATSVKYLRTVATEATYVPLLVRELARADVVHIFSAAYWSFLLAPLPAMLIARALQRPFVLNYHSGEAPDHLARSRVAREAIAKANQCVVPSSFLADVFRGFGLEASVVPNLISVDQFRFRNRSPLRPRLLSTRALGAPYNVACTLRAFREVQDRYPEATLTVAGTGRDAPELRRLAADLNLQASFVGRVEPDAMPGLLADHDLYIQSPDIDNMPLSVLEAFASGLPVVSTTVGGMATLVRHGHNGLLAPQNDHRQLAAHVVSLLDHPDIARTMASLARASVTRYTWPIVRQEWLRVYQSALGQAPALRRASA